MAKMKSSGGMGHSLLKQLQISQSQWRRTSAGVFLPTNPGRKNERRRGRVHMKALEINTSQLPSSNRYVSFRLLSVCLRVCGGVWGADGRFLNKYSGKADSSLDWPRLGVECACALVGVSESGGTRPKLEGERRASTCLLRWVSSCCVSGLNWTLPRAPTPVDWSSDSTPSTLQPWLPGKITKKKQFHLIGVICLQAYDWRGSDTKRPLFFFC